MGDLKKSTEIRCPGERSSETRAPRKWEVRQLVEALLERRFAFMSSQA